MMKRLCRFLVYAAAICALMDVGRANDLPVLKSSDLSAGTIIKTDYYSGKSLFGYIDGGAELYLEYRFQKLGRQEIRTSKETIVAEIYQMEGAYEAYGIFSIQRFKCLPVDSASPNTCQSRYQLQAVVGNCYLSIINETGTPAAQKLSVEIYQAIKAKVKPIIVPVPDIFRRPELVRYFNQLMVICGTLGIQNGLTEWETLFQGIRRFSLTLVPIDHGNEQLIVAHVRFRTKGDCAEFCRLAGFTDAKITSIQSREIGSTIRFVKPLTDEEVLFVESSISFPDRDSFVRLLAD